MIKIVLLTMMMMRINEVWTMIKIVGLAMMMMISVNKAEVSNVNGSIVSITDKSGNVWEWEQEATEKTYKKGEEITLVMNNKGTEEKVDDEIKRILR